MNRRDRRTWLRAVMKSDLPPETKRFAKFIAAGADENGIIRDPDILAALREVDRERAAEQS